MAYLNGLHKQGVTNYLLSGMILQVIFPKWFYMIPFSGFPKCFVLGSLIFPRKGSYSNELFILQVVGWSSKWLSFFF